MYVGVCQARRFETATRQLVAPRAPASRQTNPWPWDLPQKPLASLGASKKNANEHFLHGFNEGITVAVRDFEIILMSRRTAVHSTLSLGCTRYFRLKEMTGDKQVDWSTRCTVLRDLSCGLARICEVS